MSATRRVSIVLALLVLLNVFLAGGAVAKRDAPAVTHLSVTGDATVDNAGNGSYLWTNRSFTVSFDYSGLNGSTQQQACVAVANESGEWSHCEYITESDGTVTLGSPPLSGVGAYTVNASVVPSTVSDRPPLASTESSFTAIDPNGDLDGDRLNNTAEVRAGTYLDDTDSDDDGLTDGQEVLEYGTDPTEVDSDHDGLRDKVEINRGTDATDPDTDDDGLSDGAEAKRDTNATNPDTDGDGLSDGVEVELDSSPTNPDTDGDFLGDKTEVDLGTDPDNPFLPLGPVGVLLLLGVLGGLRYRGVGWPFGGDGDPAADASDPGSDPNPAARGDGAITQPPQSVTNEERVEALLAEHDGRLRQRLIVDELPWSKAKVSRVLSGMEDDGTVVKIPIGRENLVCFPDCVPENATDDAR